MAYDFETSDDAFNAVLSAIDSELRSENAHIPGRDVRGWLKLCERYKMSMPMDCELARRVYAWFEHLYGDRLKIDFRLGHTAVDVQGDLYRLHCPHFYGQIVMCCVPSLFGVQNAPANIVNSLDQIDGLTPALARKLSADECATINRAYQWSFLAFSRLMAVPETKYVKEIIDDLTTGSELLVARSPNYGMSKWASLQAVEKAFKSFIITRGQQHKHTHKMRDLHQDALSVGLPGLDLALIDAVQCSPEVRYDATLVTKQGSLIAHHAALEICSKIAPMLAVPVVIQGFRKIPARSEAIPVKVQIATTHTVEGFHPRLSTSRVRALDSPDEPQCCLHTRLLSSS